MSYFGIPPARERTSQNRVTYTAGAGQTSFAISYSPPNVDVFQNGSKLQYGVDYTAVDGANVVLTVGATLGDIVDLESIKTSNPYDNYTKSQIDTLQGIFYAVATGTVDALAVTTTPLIPALVNGVEVRIRTSGANATTTPTVTFSNLGVAKTITTQGNQALPVGSWAANQEITLRYNNVTDKLEWLASVGEATVAEIITGTSTNKAVTPAGLRAALGFSSFYESAAQNTTNSGLLTLTHGLPRIPINVILVYSFIAAVAGYTIGDLIIVNPYFSRADGTPVGYSITPTSSTLLIRASNTSSPAVMHKTTGVMTNIAYTDFQLIVRAWA